MSNKRLIEPDADTNMGILGLAGEPAGLKEIMAMAKTSNRAKISLALHLLLKKELISATEDFPPKFYLKNSPGAMELLKADVYMTTSSHMIDRNTVDPESILVVLQKSGDEMAIHEIMTVSGISRQGMVQYALDSLIEAGRVLAIEEKSPLGTSKHRYKAIDLAPPNVSREHRLFSVAVAKRQQMERVGSERAQKLIIGVLQSFPHALTYRDICTYLPINGTEILNNLHVLTQDKTLLSLSGKEPRYTLLKAGTPDYSHLVRLY